MHHRATLILFAAIALHGCGKDGLYFRSGGAADVVDSQAGWFGRDREIAISDDNHRYTPVATIRDPVAVSAEWRHDGAVEIFVIGGRVVACNPRLEAFTVHLHQTRSEYYQAPDLDDHHSAAAFFRQIPDTCANPT